MPDRSRLTPLFGALIATAATLYAATQSSRPPREERGATARPGWGRILANTWAELDRDHVSIMAAGIAFYALLSIFPGMSALISIYGLAADPAVIERQLNAISGILPQEALMLLSSQLHTLVAAPSGQLGIGLIVSLSLTVWSATSGTGVLMQALTIAFEEKETRGLVPFYFRAIGLTLGVGLLAVLSLFLIAVVPAVIDMPLPELWRDRISPIR
jgi:membrane protein